MLRLKLLVMEKLALATPGRLRVLLHFGQSILVVYLTIAA